jgi:hypothetical protein
MVDDNDAILDAPGAFMLGFFSMACMDYSCMVQMYDDDDDDDYQCRLM